MELVKNAGLAHEVAGWINETAVSPRLAREALALLALDEIVLRQMVVVFFPLEDTVDLYPREWAVKNGLLDG